MRSATQISVSEIGESSRVISRWTASDRRGLSPSSADAVCSPLPELRFDQLDGVADRLHVVDVVIGDLDVEDVLELEHDVDEPSGVHLELVQDVRR